MIRSKARRGDGRVVNILIPETNADIAELQLLYDSGRLQAGDSVKQKRSEVGKITDPQKVAV